MPGPAATERQALADTLADLGPGAPTLLPGWSTSDLAAHLVVRESQPLALPGMVGGPLAPVTSWLTTRRRQASTYDELVGRFRSGPPLGVFALPGMEEQANLAEFFVHHEDARRANGLEPRDVPGVDAALAGRLRRLAPLLARRVRGVGLLLEPGSLGLVTARRGPSPVTVSGAASELVLWLFGRGDAARVSLSGEQASLARVRGAKLGL